MIEWELHDRIKKIYKKARKLQRWGKSTTFAQCGEVWKPEWAKKKPVTYDDLRDMIRKAVK